MSTSWQKSTCKFKEIIIIGEDVIDYLKKVPDLFEHYRDSIQAGRKPFNAKTLSFEDNYYTVRGRPVDNGMIITIEDVTGTVEMESDILHAMIEGQELERRRIAKEIHDGVGPILSTIKINLETIRSELNLSSLDINKFDSVMKLIDSITTEMRSISHDLMPKALVDFGLIAVLNNMTVKVNESRKLEVSFYHSEINKRLNIDIEINLYRISQELLNNCLKHSCAEKLNIQLIMHEGVLVLTVEDDGSGFDVEEVWEKSDGIGLTNIESRVKALGGELIIDSAPGRGTLVSIEVPL